MSKLLTSFQNARGREILFPAHPCPLNCKVKMTGKREFQSGISPRSIEKVRKILIIYGSEAARIQEESKRRADETRAV